MKTYFLKIVFAFSFFILTLLPFTAFAGTEHNMSGYAWSSTIGWISFNSTNCDVDGNGHLDVNCGGNNSTGSVVDYGVKKNTDNTIVGYAWSPNIGWIQFGDLDTGIMPTGSGTQKDNAKIVGNNLKGWAKALSADGNGWDGWIALSGSSGTGSYGVSFSSTTGKFSSFGWGGEVVGWLSFDADGTNGVTIQNYNVDGGWSDWGACIDGIQSRTCTNPTPSGDGTDCSLLDGGNSTQSCVDGGWSDWGACIDGIQSRTCTNPTPSGDGTDCVGSNTQTCISNPITGSCATTHYNCSSSVESTNHVSSPSKWTWVCPGSDGGVSKSCSENKTPIFIED